MKRNSRLSRMLHVLLHLARSKEPLTSDQIARMLGTNAVVVRRTMAGLRESGYVRSEKGHGGGWTISGDLAAVSLLDIHRAVGGPEFFAIDKGRGSPGCAVERVVNDALGEALREAEALLLRRLAAITLAELARAFDLECQLPCHPSQNGG